MSDMLPPPLPEYFKKCTLISKEGLPSTAEQLFYSLTLSEEECTRIEHATREQTNSVEWHQQRQGRLTASTFHKIFGMRKQTDPVNAAKRLLSKPDISAVQWGISKEDTAKQDHISKMSSHTNFEYTTAGFVVNSRFPYLGASPDGFIKCNCCGKGLVEIKCPFAAKDMHPDAIRGKPQSCMGEKGVVTSHSYYTQIQGQFVITESQYYDLAV